MRCECAKFKIIFLGVFIAALLAITSQARAANWYVDPNASGINNGTSWANAWTSFSSIVWGASGVKAGDTLYISGGATSQTYTSTLTVGASGSADRPITIRVGQDAGHNGEVIFDFDALGDSGTGQGINISGRSYIVIDGRVGTERRLTIKNLRNISSMMQGHAIAASSTSYITVQYVNIDNCNTAFWGTYGTGWNINNNRLTGIRGDVGIRVLPSTGGWDSTTIHHNYIGIVVRQSNNAGPDGIQNEHGVSIYNNTFTVNKVDYSTSAQHPDYIQNIGSYVKVYNNDFINIGDSAFNFSGAAAEPNTHDVLIYNNTFRITTEVDTYPEYIRFYNCGESLTNIKIFNNTFIDNPWITVVFACTNYTWGNTTGSGIEIKNNIWYKSGLSAPRPALSLAGGYFTESSFDIDNNIYYGGAYISYFGTSYTAATWIASREPNSSTSQPTFVSYVANEINNDLHLSAGDTVARDHGTSLSAYFTTDKDGNTRSGSWDIGAYEYVSGATLAPPAAPGGLTVR